MKNVNGFEKGQVVVINSEGYACLNAGVRPALIMSENKVSGKYKIAHMATNADGVYVGSNGVNKNAIALPNLTEEIDAKIIRGAAFKITDEEMLNVEMAYT